MARVVPSFLFLAKQYVVNGHLLFLGTNGVQYLHWTLKNHYVLQEREGASRESATGRDGHAASPGVKQVGFCPWPSSRGQWGGPPV